MLSPDHKADAPRCSLSLVGPPEAWISLYFKCQLGFWFIFYSLLLTITINLWIYCPPSDFSIGTHDSSLKIQHKWFPAKMFINFLSSTHAFYYKYIKIIKCETESQIGNVMLRTKTDIFVNWKWKNTIKEDQGWSCGTAKFSQGIGSGISKTRHLQDQRTKTLSELEVSQKGVYRVRLCVSLWKRSLMKNKNKSAVSNYLILQVLASGWPVEAGGLMHSYTEEVNQAACWFFDWVYIIPNVTVSRSCEVPSGWQGGSQWWGHWQNYCHERRLQMEKKKHTHTPK